MSAGNIILQGQILTKCINNEVYFQPCDDAIIIVNCKKAINESRWENYEYSFVHFQRVSYTVHMNERQFITIKRMEIRRATQAI